MADEPTPKQDALTIFRAALEAADAAHAVTRHSRMPGGQFEHVIMIAAGKAAYAMADAAVKQVGRKPDRVLVITKYGHAGPPRSGWDIYESGHPIPDENGLRAAYAVRDSILNLSTRDLVIVAVSGGASALLPAPAEPVTLEDKQCTTGLLLKAGANIHELNTVRKQLSFLKGGRLAALAHPARVIGLLLSDVIGDPPAVIGSGLTVPDNTTPAEAIDVLHRFRVWDTIPESVRTRLNHMEPVGPAAAENILVGSNKLALEAACDRARRLGYRATIVSDCLRGESREVAREQAALLKKAGPGECLLSGGETTVTVRGHGKGGRNQEFALAIACEIAGDPDRAALCGGTDGTDGPTDAAGAYVNGMTVERARRLGMNPSQFLDDNNAYSFFECLDDLIKTGPTGTNVMDINIMLVRKS